MHLYELTDAYRMLLEADDGDAFAEALSQLGGEIAAKAESIAKVVRSLESERAAIEDEVERLRARAMARNNRVVALKDYLKLIMEAAGIKKIGGVVLDVALQNSPPSCVVEDAATVPDAYQVVIPASIRVDSRAIIEHWKETGEQVPGTVVAQGTHIRIR